jgi:DNA-binding MarR family transcriptional regulator
LYGATVESGQPGGLVPGSGTSFPDDVLSDLLRRFARFGALLEPHDHGGIRASLSEVLALGELSVSEGMSQQELADLLGLEKSTVSRLVSGMAARGWLTRERHPANRRVTRLELTEAGRLAAERIGRDLRQRHHAMFSAMTAEERQALTVGLGALARVVEHAAAQHPARITEA